MLEDRADLGAQVLAKAANDLVAAANKDKTFGELTRCSMQARPLCTPILIDSRRKDRPYANRYLLNRCRSYMGSQYVNDFNFNGRTYPVYVQGDEKYRRSSQDIAQLKARNASGEMVPLGTVVTFKDETKPYRAPATTSIPQPR